MSLKSWIDEHIWEPINDFGSKIFGGGPKDPGNGTSVYIGGSAPIGPGANTAGSENSGSNWAQWALGTAAQIGYNEYTRREQNKFNAEQAAYQRAWEENMSNTAYQRAYEDMKKAGINPNLAGGGGGASTPSGSSASSGSAMPLDIANIQSVTALTKAQKDNIEADTALKNKQSGKTEEEQKAIRTNTRIQEETNKIQQAIMKGDLTKKQYEIMIDEATTRLLQEEIGIKEAEKKTAVNNRRWHEIRDSITAFIPFVGGSAAWRPKGGGITINNN